MSDSADGAERDRGTSHLKIKPHLALWGFASLLVVRVRAQARQPPSFSRPHPATQAEAGDQANNVDPNQVGPQSMLPHLQGTRFWLSGQANFIFQAHPEFQAFLSLKPRS
jgi:hypothetical protein